MPGVPINTLVVQVDGYALQEGTRLLWELVLSPFRNLGRILLAKAGRYRVVLLNLLTTLGISDVLCLFFHRYQESSSEPCSDSDQSYLRPDWRLQSAPQERRELEGCSANSSPVSSCRASPRTSLHFPDDSPSFEHKSSSDFTAG